MVLSPPSADAASTSTDWLDEVSAAFELAARGILVLVDNARPSQLPALYRHLHARNPETSVVAGVAALIALPPGATVIFTPNPAEADWMNLHRPVFLERGYRIVLWCSTEVSAVLAREAPDFFDWISLRVECPPDVVAHGAPAPPHASATNADPPRVSSDPYDRPITRAKPTAILVLLDESGSMNGPFGGKEGVSKRDAVAQIANEYIDTLITTCLQPNGAIFDYFFVRMIGFGGRGVRSLLPDEWLSVSQLDLLSTELIPPDQHEPQSTWVQPEASGRTPGAAALAAAHAHLQDWIHGHPDSHPPVLFVVSDGDMGEDAATIAERIGMLPGPPLVLCAYISATVTTPVVFPDQLPADLTTNHDAKFLWRLASVLPPRMKMNIQRSFRQLDPLRDGARAYMFNVTSPAYLRALLRGGTPRNQ